MGNWGTVQRKRSAHFVVSLSNGKNQKRCHFAAFDANKIDLGRWLDEGYGLPIERSDDGFDGSDQEQATD